MTWSSGSKLTINIDQINGFYGHLAVGYNRSNAHTTYYNITNMTYKFDPSKSVFLIVIPNTTASSFSISFSY